MEWTDDAILLTARPHGETAAIVTLLTALHGRHAGLVQGGQSKRQQAILQSGNQLQARWHARLLDHLGTFSLEVETAFAARWFDNPEILALISSATAMAEMCLPERQPMNGVYAGLCALLALEDSSLWGPVYVKWEMELLKALGYGLDLSHCTVTGETNVPLSHVSPRTGRAVSARAAAPYAPRLLPLPRFLCGAGTWDDQDILDGLNLTGHFLVRAAVLHGYGAGDIAPFPPARQRLLDLYRARGQRAQKSCA